MNKHKSFKSHMDLHNDEKHDCILYCAIFKILRYLKIHRKKEHTNDMEFLSKTLTNEDSHVKCDVCQLKFVTTNSSCLSSHCKVCNLKVNTRYELDQHNENKHRCQCQILNDQKVESLRKEIKHPISKCLAMYVEIKLSLSQL